MESQSHSHNRLGWALVANFGTHPTWCREPLRRPSDCASWAVKVWGSLGFWSLFLSSILGLLGFHVFSQPSADFSKLLIDVQSRGSTPQPLQELDAKFRRMWHEMLKKSWGKVNNDRLTTHHTSPHPISLLNRGPTDGIGLGSASSCVSWPRQASASCDVPGLVEIQW